LWISEYDATTGGLIKKGVFSSSLYLPTVNAQWHIAGAGAFNGDGYADLVWENTSTGARTIWFMNKGVLSSSYSLGTVNTQWQIEDH
jgi:hypothetical protein